MTKATEEEIARSAPPSKNRGREKSFDFTQDKFFGGLRINKRGHVRRGEAEGSEIKVRPKNPDLVGIYR